MSAAAGVLLYPVKGSAAPATWINTGGPGAGNGEGVVSVSCGPAQTLYVGTASGGVWQYRVDNETWTNIGNPGGPGQQICSFMKDGGGVYAGTGAGNVYRAYAWQSTWTDMACPATDRIFSLAQDFDYIYAASGDGTVYKKPVSLKDTTWTSAGSPGSGRIYSMCGSWGILYAASEDGTVYRNTNPSQGTTWEPMGTPDGSEARCLHYSSIGDGELFAGTADGNVFRNGEPGNGSTWTAAGSFGESISVQGISYDGKNDILYAGTVGGRVYKNIYPDNSDAWMDLGCPSVHEPGLYGGPVICDSNDNLLFAGTLDSTGHGNLYKTSIPVIASITPGCSLRGESLSVVIDGSNTDFASNAVVHFESKGITVKSSRIENPERITADIVVGHENVNYYNDVWVTYNNRYGEAEKTNMKCAFIVYGVDSSSTWYLAEGTCAWGFNTYITVENPNTAAVSARLTYMSTHTGSENDLIKSRTVTLPPESQTTIDPRWDIDNTDFSTMVECLEEKPIAVDRTMIWTGEGAVSPEGHNSIGATEPARCWYLPEGSSDHGFETWTLIMNPDKEEANVELTYMPENEKPKKVNKVIPPRSRVSCSMEEDIGMADASVAVSSNKGLVVERSMYRNNRREGSCSIGATEPSKEYYLAEGTTYYGFTTYLLIQNPCQRDVEITVTYMTPKGPREQPKFIMPAESRETIRVNDVHMSSDCAIKVSGDRDIVAERAMYWGEGVQNQAMHASIGLPSGYNIFYIPDGQTSNGFETYTLIQNPGEEDVEVRITYLPQSGEPVSFVEKIPAGSRRTYDMADKIKDGRASIYVKDMDEDNTIVVERAMYWNSRRAGTVTAGGRSLLISPPFMPIVVPVY